MAVSSASDRMCSHASVWYLFGMEAEDLGEMPPKLLKSLASPRSRDLENTADS